MSEARRPELEEMAATLLATALNLSQGNQSDDALLKFKFPCAYSCSGERRKGEEMNVLRARPWTPHEDIVFQRLAAAGKHAAAIAADMNLVTWRSKVAPGR